MIVCNFLCISVRYFLGIIFLQLVGKWEIVAHLFFAVVVVAFSSYTSSLLQLCCNVLRFHIMIFFSASSIRKLWRDWNWMKKRGNICRQYDAVRIRFYEFNHPWTNNKCDINVLYICLVWCCFFFEKKNNNGKNGEKVRDWK